MKLSVKIFSILTAACLCVFFCSCSQSEASSSADGSSNSSGSSSGSSSASSSDTAAKEEELTENDMFTSRDLSGDYDESEAVKITLGDSIVISGGSSAKADGSTITISEEGVYILSGKLDDGNIIVDCADETAKVQLVLNNAEIKCSNYAPIFAKSADKLFITLAENSENVIEDSGEYVLGEDDSNVDGAVFARCTTTINGSGNLTVKGTQAHAVVSKDNLKITGGSLNVEAVSDALQGKDSVRICGGEINVKAGEDGVKTSNDEDEDKGNVYINGGSLTIDAGDDGVHAENQLEILDGTINITNSYEGLEGADITISGGNISVVASDDGLNAAGGSDGEMAGGSPFEFQNLQGSDYSLKITGGYLLVNAGGDGLDSNGTLTIEGGVVLVSGPEDSGNGAIDYETGAEITGGTVIAVGSAGMAETFADTSTQYSFMTNLSSAQSAGTSVAVTDENDNVLISFTSPKRFENIVASCASFENNKEYKIVVGGTVENADENGYADSGTVSGGSEDSTITLTSISTSNGGGMGGFGGGMGGDPGMRGGMGGGRMENPGEIGEPGAM